MQFFLLLSLLLLYLAYSRRNYYLMICGVVIFFFSAALYPVAYALAPTYLLTLFFILWLQRKSFVAYAGVFATFIGTTTILYLPLLLYFTKDQHALSSFLASSHALLTVDFSHILQNLSTRGEVFLNFFLFRDGPLSLFALLLAYSFVIVSAAYLYYGRQDKKRKVIVLILLIGIIQFFAVIATISVSPIVSFPIRYFTPLLAITIICIAEIVHNIIPKRQWFGFLESMVVILLLFIFSPNLQQRLIAATRLAVSHPVDFLLPPYVVPPFIRAVQNEIISIKEKEQRQDFYFFSVRTYRFGREDPWSNEVFWTPLERSFNIPLVVLDDNMQRDYRPIGNIEYIFINCGYDDGVTNKCPDLFHVQFSDYKIKKRIYDNPAIYVARKRDA